MAHLPYWIGRLDLTRIGVVTHVAVLRGDGWETPAFVALGRQRAVRKAQRHARRYGIEVRDAAPQIAFGAEHVGAGVSTA